MENGRAFSAVDHTLAELPPVPVVRWKVYNTSCSWRSYNGSDDPVTSRIIWNDIVLTGVGWRTDPLVSVDVYIVRANGTVVRHECWWHKPKSVFHVIRPGHFARLRVFTNVTNVLVEWPTACADIPAVPGTVVVLAKDVAGQLVRHTFAFPFGRDKLWETGGPVTAPLPVGYVFKKPRRPRRVFED